MSDDIEKVLPFDSFSVVYKILGWAGYYRALNKPSSGLKRILHQIYRPLAFLILFIYNLQHLIFTAQNLFDAEKLMDSLVIGIPEMNSLAKVSTTFFQGTRLAKLNNFLKDDPTFRASDAKGQSILLKNRNEMHRLCKALIIIVTVTGLTWPASYIVRRYKDPNQIVPSYVPFSTDTWPKFYLSVFLECFPVLWVGHGHIAFDALISTFYAHAHTQIKIIKQQLESLQVDDGYYLKRYFRYTDLNDNSVQTRFVQIVKRYDKVVWYTNEVDTIFNFSVTFQFLTSAASICFVIYRMSIISIKSFPFTFTVLLFAIFLTQLLLYCYYGNLLEFESRFLNNSLYNCAWLALSPRFRRQMLIAMSRWSRPIQPRVCCVIPLSLSTFITIVKSAYTLYTVLVTTNLNF